MKNKQNNRIYIQKTVLVAMFVAISYVVEFFHINVQFLSFDAKDSIITVAAMIFGPSYAVIMSLCVSLLEMITISGTGFWGFLMNFCGSVTFSFTASLIYKYKRNMTHAVLGLVSASLLTIVVMLCANMLITPIYMGTDVGTVILLIPSLLLPFNTLKTVFNSGLVLLLYKPIIRVLRGVHFLPESNAKTDKKRTAAVAVVAFVFIGIAILGFLVLNGRLKLF